MGNVNSPQGSFNKYFDSMSWLISIDWWYTFESSGLKYEQYCLSYKESPVWNIMPILLEIKSLEVAYCPMYEFL